MLFQWWSKKKKSLLNFFFSSASDFYLDVLEDLTIIVSRSFPNLPVTKSEAK